MISHCLALLFFPKTFACSFDNDNFSWIDLLPPAAHVSLNFLGCFFLFGNYVQHPSKRLVDGADVFFLSRQKHSTAQQFKLSRKMFLMTPRSRCWSHCLLLCLSLSTVFWWFSDRFTLNRLLHHRRCYSGDAWRKQHEICWNLSARSLSFSIPHQPFSLFCVFLQRITMLWDYFRCARRLSMGIQRYFRDDCVRRRNKNDKNTHFS